MSVGPTNVLVIGAGPIGLATAIQTKIRNPNINITVLDKNEQYSRTQKLRLDPTSFWQMPDHDELKEIISSFNKKKIVPIQEIEEKFKSLAVKLGIQFAIREMNDDSFDQILEDYPDAGCVVAADGARSFIRKKVFQDDMYENVSVKYLVQVQYHTQNNTSRLGLYRKNQAQNDTGTLVVESVSNQREVSLRFFIDEEAFEAIKEAKSKEPWHLSDPRIPPEVKEKINTWIGSRKKVFEEEIDGEPTITGIELKIYSSRAKVKRFQGRSFCLVGDASGGVPFFRSINKGFLESSALAACLADVGELSPNQAEQSPHVERKFKKYQSHARAIAFWENLAAKIKALFIKVLIFFIMCINFITSGKLSDWFEKYKWGRKADDGLVLSTELAT